MERRFCVFWAFDPVDSDELVLRHAVDALVQLKSSIGSIEVVPVHLYYHVEDTPDSVDLASLKDRLKKCVDGRLSAVDLAELEVIQVEGGTEGHMLDAFVKKAESSKADLVLVGTHHRSGVLRWITGSFAESLIQKSGTPVWVVGKQASFEGSLKRILFATDFGKAANLAFVQIIEMAKSSQAELILFHQVPADVEPYVGATVGFFGGGMPNIAQNFSQAAETAEEKLKKLQAVALKEGVQTTFYVDVQGSYILDSIFKAAEKFEVGTIGVASEKGTLASLALGSVSRELTRKSRWPVWVVHPDLEEGEEVLKNLF